MSRISHLEHEIMNFLLNVLWITSPKLHFGHEYFNLHPDGSTMDLWISYGMVYPPVCIEQIVNLNSVKMNI